MVGYLNVIELAEKRFERGHAQRVRSSRYPVHVNFADAGACHSDEIAVIRPVESSLDTRGKATLFTELGQPVTICPSIAIHVGWRKTATRLVNGNAEGI